MYYGAVYSPTQSPTASPTTASPTQSPTVSPTTTASPDTANFATTSPREKPDTIVPVLAAIGDLAIVGGARPARPTCHERLYLARRHTESYMSTWLRRQQSGARTFTVDPSQMRRAKSRDRESIELKGQVSC